jgi:glycosyltransferase involved in cell wall biosynthesis
MTKVLHVIAPAAFGGLERVVESLAVAQHRRGHVVHVAAFIEQDRAEPPILGALRTAGVSVAVMRSAARAYGAQRRQLQMVIRSISPDVVHSHGYVADVMLALVARSARRVSTVHGFTGGGLKNQGYEWLQRQAFRRFECVVAVSRKLAGELVRGGLSSNQVLTIANACPPLEPPLEHAVARRLLKVPDERFSIGWVGRVSHEKGLDVLIEALVLVSTMPWHLTIIGDGRERARLEQRASDLGLADKITWQGMVENAARMMHGFDLFVISSRTEGTPIALFEAMHGGVPVVTTAVGGIPDVVSVTEAILVPAEQPALLADAIVAAMRDRDSARQRAEHARRRLEADFGLDQWLDRYDRAYGAPQSPARHVTLDQRSGT